MAATNLAPISDEELERQALEIQQAIHGGLTIGAASQVVPPVVGGADWRAPSSYLPGLGTYLYSMGSGLAELAGNAVRRNPVQVDPESGQPLVDAATHQQMVKEAAAQPDFVIPGHAAAEELNKQSVEAAKKVLPVDAPTNELQQKAQDLGIAFAQAGTGVVPEIGGLPKAVSTALKFAGPPEKTAPVGALLGGSAELLKQEADKDKPDPYAGVLNPEVQPQPTRAEIAARDPYAGVANPEATVATQPDPYAGVANPEAAIGARPDVAAPTPDNDWGWSIGKTLLYSTAAVAGAWALAKAGPKGINYIADLIRQTPRDAGVAEQALRTGSMGGSKAVEMPLPNDAGGWTRQWAMRNVNPNAVLNEYVRSPMVSPTAAEADARVATNELINNPANAQRRMEGLFRTGEEEGTGHVFPKVVDYKRTIDGLTPTQQELFDGAAWYKSELNLRDQNIKANANNGIMWSDATDKAVRVSFPNISTPAMRDAVLFAEQDPAVKAALEANKALQMSVIDRAEKYGNISAAQANRARTAYPDFMPTLDTQGNRLHSWDDKIRDPGTGYGNTPPAKAWQAMIDHFGSSIKEMQLNEWRRSYLLEAQRLQETNPAFPKVVSTSTPEQFLPRGSNSGVPITPEQPVGPSATKRSITVMVDGVPQSFDIHNTSLWQSLGGGPQQLYIGSGIGNMARKVIQELNTGAASALTGAPFAAKTVIRDIGLIPSQMPTTAWRGSIEAGLGRRIPGLPFDPTFPINVGRTMAGDVTTVLAKHYVDILASPGNSASAALRKMFGNQKIDALVDWARAQIDKTNLEQRTAMGVGGGGNKSILGMQTPLNPKGTYTDPTGHAVSPSLVGKPNFDLIPSKWPLPNFLRNTVNGLVRGTAESFIDVNRLVRELYSVISDAPHSAMHDLNIGNPNFTPRTLAATIQNVTGNPGTRGTGMWAQMAASNLPWYNTSMQAGAASLRAFRNHPIAMGSTIATVLTLGSLAEHLSALMSGKEHVQDLEDGLSNSAKARNFIIYHGQGTHPSDHTEIPIQQEWGWLKPFHSALMGQLIGTWNAHGNEDALSRLIHTIADVFDQHVTTDVAAQTGIGAVNAAVPVGLPPLTSTTVTALTGQQVQNPADQMLSNAIHGQDVLSHFTRGGGPQHTTPGQDGSDGLLNRTDSGTLKAVLSGIGGAAGAAYDMYHQFNMRSKIDPDHANNSWAWDGFWRDYKQQWQDNTRYANGVWRNNLPMSTFGSLEERTANMWNAVNKVSNVRSDIRGEGFSSVTRGVPIQVTSPSPVPPMTDPQMRNLYITTAEIGKGIEREIMPREREIRAQMDNLKSTPFMPDERRRIGNQLSEKLYAVTAEKHAALLELNAKLTQLAGGRHVDVSRIDWGKGMDQFHY